MESKLQLEQLADMTSSQTLGAFFTFISVAILLPLMTQLNMIPFAIFMLPFITIVVIYATIVANFYKPIIHTFIFISLEVFWFSIITLFMIFAVGPITLLFVTTGFSSLITSACALVMLFSC